MLTKPLIFRSALAAVLLAAGTALPVAAQAHDRDYRDYSDYRWRQYDRPDYRWEHRPHWVRSHDYWRAQRFYDRHYVAPRGYYRYYDGYRAYNSPEPGATIIYRHHWQ